jgi:hypothetical protein
MNLDHNDEIIKRRLAQKMNFLSNDLATLKEPTEDELRKYYEDNREKYMLSPIYSFYQLSFRSDSRNNPQADAKKYLENLDGKGPEKFEGQGDKLPFPYYFELTDRHELDRQLGMDFAQSLEGLDIAMWSGPVRSGFGWHLVYLTEKVPTRAPEFESIVNELKRDFEYENQRRINDQVYSELRRSYEIEFDLDPEKFDEAFVEYLKSKDGSND